MHDRLLDATIENIHKQVTGVNSGKVSSEKDPSDDKWTLDNNGKAAIWKRSQKEHHSKQSVAALDASTGRKSAVMMACLYMHICSYGLPAALAVVYADLIPALKAPRFLAALVPSLCMGGSYAGGIFFTGPIRTFGSGKCVILASVVGTVAMALTFFATNIQMIIVSVGVVSGLALSVFLLTGYVAVGQIFTTHKKVALAVLTLGGTVGQTILPKVTQSLIGTYNWNGAILVLSALVMLNCVPCGLILWCSKEHLLSEPEACIETKENSRWNYCAWFGDIAFVLFVLTTFLSRIVCPIEQWFIADLALIKGFNKTDGADLLSINGLCGFVGRVMTTLALKILPNIASDVHLGYSLVLCGLGHFLVISALTYWEICLAMVIRGAFYGVMIGITPAMELDIRGPEFYMETMAICHLVTGLGNILGGYLGGLSVDLTGDYVLMFYISTAVSVYCGLSMVPIYLIRKRKQRLDELKSPYQEIR